MFEYQHFGPNGQGAVTIEVYARDGSKVREIVARVLPSPDNAQPVIHFVNSQVPVDELMSMIEVVTKGWQPIPQSAAALSEKEQLLARLQELEGT